MTRVTFYILQGNSSRNAGLLALCRITEKAVARKHQVCIATGSEHDAENMDRLLWTYDEQSFLAHEVINSSPTQAEEGESSAESQVLITAGTPTEACDDLLINLNEEVPVYFSRFQRVIEIVAGDETEKAAARERYKFYKDRGYPMETHNLNR